MANLARFAVFAILASESHKLIRDEQYYLTSLTGNNLAFGFPIHITLKGRFLAYENTAMTVFNDAVKKILKNFHSDFRPSSKIIYLSKPKYISSQLSWIEVLPDTQGFYTLLNFHNYFEQEMNNFLVIDEVPEEHKNENFCPHITLGWGVTKENWYQYSIKRRFNLSQTQITYIALALYPKDWPLEESVNLVIKIPI